MNHDKIFIETTHVLSKMSKCQSKKVCAVAVKNGRIIATGLNGSISGAINCCDKFPEGVNKENRSEHHEWSLENELHAEMNLILECAKNGRTLKGATLYINLQPCDKCALSLANSGIVRIIYDKEYDFSNLEKIKNIFRNANIEFSQI